jgi:hypothetical protein
MHCPACSLVGETNAAVFPQRLPRSPSCVVKKSGASVTHGVQISHFSAQHIPAQRVRLARRDQERNCKFKVDGPRKLLARCRRRFYSPFPAAP